MGRAFYVYGENLVYVKGNGALAAIPNQAQLHELGLSSEAIRITPKFNHVDFKCDDFADTPPDVFYALAECRVDMTLIHYDPSVLERCMVESMGGGGIVASGITISGIMSAGVMAPSYTPMGGGKDLMTSGNHYIMLNIVPNTIEREPWRFPSSYLADRPLELPLGTERSLVKLSWRAIPYAYIGSLDNKEISSSGVVLWDHKQEPA